MRSGPGQNEGAWGGSSDEVSFLVDKNAHRHKPGTQSDRHFYIVLLKGGSIRKTKSDMWTQGPPINNSEVPVDRGGDKERRKFQRT